MIHLSKPRDLTRECAKADTELRARGDGPIPEWVWMTANASRVAQENAGTRQRNIL